MSRPDCQGSSEEECCGGSELIENACLPDCEQACVPPKKLRPVESEKRWSYYDITDINSLKVHDWCSVYPCGSRQSPINLDIKNSSVCEKANFPKLVFKYKTKDVETIQNTGTGVKFSSYGKSKITGGPLHNDIYQLAQFHFHWGKTCNTGSEHLLDGKQFPGELHLVHFNQKYGCISEAIKYGDGLCVVGVFMKEQKNNNLSYKMLTDQLCKVEESWSEYPFLFDYASFDPSMLLPKNIQDYTFYEGSLTTPPLNESVLWINLLQPVSVSNNQFQAFRSLMNPIGKPIFDNYRPVQDLKCRKIQLHQQKK